MAKGERALTLGELAAELDGALHGPEGQPVTGPVPFDSDDPEGIAYAVTREYLQAAERSRVGALLLPRELRSERKPYIHVDDPKAAFLKLLRLVERPLHLDKGHHPTAIIDPHADIDPTATIGPYAVIERGARIGPGCRVYPFAYIGEDCVLAEQCAILPHAVLYRKVTLGARTVVHAGAVLGADGFGYAWDGRQRVKVPQVGSVTIGADCEIGALSAIDRATMGQTSLGEGTKIDNLVQIAHNVRIGSHGAIAAQAGIGGSASIGDRVLLGGQVGVADHVCVADDVALAGRAAALQDISEPGEHLGIPARPSAAARKNLLLATRLTDLFERLRRLERRLGERGH